MALEIMDSMFKPEGYGGVYLGAFFYIFSLTLPHSIAANLAYPHKVSPCPWIYAARPGLPQNTPARHGSATALTRQRCDTSWEGPSSAPRQARIFMRWSLLCRCC